jgi:hypothetical protein
MSTRTIRSITMARKPAYLPLPPPPLPPPSMHASWIEPLLNSYFADANVSKQQRKAQLPRPSYPTGSFGNGVEVAFLLTSWNINSAKAIRELSRVISVSYNDYLARVAPGHPPRCTMQSIACFRPQFAEWSLDSESTIETSNRESAPCEYMLSISCSSLWVIRSANNTSSWGLGEHLVNIPRP